MEDQNGGISQFLFLFLALLPFMVCLYVFEGRPVVFYWYEG